MNKGKLIYRKMNICLIFRSVRNVQMYFGMFGVFYYKLFVFVFVVFSVYRNIF